MAVITKDDLLARVSGYIGEDDSDDAIGLLEDVSDTLNDFEARSGTDWEKKYNENDANWRKRYMERFRSIDVDKDTADQVEVVQQPESEATETHDDGENPEEITIDDLFEDA